MMVLACCILPTGHIAQAQSMQPETYSDYDPDGAGKVSRRQWLDHDWKTDIQRYDSNHDGHIEKREFVAAFCGRIDFDLGRHIARCARDIDRYFDVLDINRDGELNRIESERQSLKFFALNDNNHDGFVTQAEIEEVARGK